MRDTTGQRHIMTIAMGAMLLITLATTVIVGKHYWDMLSGVFLIALIGLALPDWAAWWASYLHAKATRDGQEDPGVAKTCLVTSGALSLMMIINAGAVLSVWWDDQQKATTETRATTAGVERQNAANAGVTNAIEARGRVVQQMKAAGVSDRAIREFLRSEADRDKAKTLTEKPSVETATTTYVGNVPEPVRRYMAFWVYIVPFLGGLIGVFAIIVSVQRPGGVEFGNRQNEFTQTEIEVEK